MSSTFSFETSEKTAYLDNAATTKPCEQAIETAMHCMRTSYGNPSSLHRVGLEAELALTRARKQIAALLGAEQNEILFTSGATESSLTAILSAAQTGKRKGTRIVTTNIEHASVTAAVDSLARQGYDVVRVAPENGAISADALINAVTEDTILVSAMLVCNENGHTLPIGEAFGQIKRRFPHVLTHCDAVQAFGKLDFTAKSLHADFISISGHKIHGIKGAGALYVKKGTRLIPLMLGGGQERGLRSGTEPLPAIAAFGAAAQEASPGKSLQAVTEVYDYAVARLQKLDFVQLNIPPNALPYFINLSVGGIRSEVLLHFLEERGVYVSSGSACAKGAKSKVLAAFGISGKRLDSAIRVSLSRFSTKAEIDLLIDGLIEGERTLHR